MGFHPFQTQKNKMSESRRELPMYSSLDSGHVRRRDNCGASNCPFWSYMAKISGNSRYFFRMHMSRCMPRDDLHQPSRPFVRIYAWIMNPRFTSITNGTICQVRP